MAKTNITVSIHWEGRSFQGVEYLAQMRRQQLANVPMTHFVSAAYFARGGCTEEIVARMLPAFLARDELALHVHPWRSIRGAAETIDETIVEGPDPILDIDHAGISPQRDCGFTVPICAYPKPIIDGYIQNSRHLLRPLLTALVTRKGMLVDRMLKGIRAGHGMANDAFLACVQRAGFVYDASGIDGVWSHQAARRARESTDAVHRGGSFAPLLDKWSTLWGPARDVPAANGVANTMLLATTSGAGINATSQPFCIYRSDTAPLIEMPLNGGLIPPMAPQEVLRAIGSALEAPAGAERIVSFAIRQETAEDSLNEVLASSIVRHPDLHWTTNIDLLQSIATVNPEPRRNLSEWDATREHFRRQAQRRGPPPDPATAVVVPTIQIPRIDTNYGTSA